MHGKAREGDGVIDEVEHSPAEQDVREGEARRRDGDCLEVVDLLPAGAQPLEEPLRHAAPSLIAVVAIHDDDA